MLSPIILVLYAILKVLYVADFDECRFGTSDSDANAVCNNYNGGFSCICSAGFTGDGRVCYNGMCMYTKIISVRNSNCMGLVNCSC